MGNLVERTKQRPNVQLAPEDTCTVLASRLRTRYALAKITIVIE